MDERFPKSARLTGSRDFIRVLKGSRRFRNEYLMVYVAQRPAPDLSPPGSSRLETSLPSGARLGLIVSKKVGKAVRRNRMKRLIREIFRHHRKYLGRNIDVVVRPRERSATLTYSELERILLEALQGCGAIKYEKNGGRKDKGSKQ